MARRAAATGATAVCDVRCSELDRADLAQPGIAAVCPLTDAEPDPDISIREATRLLAERLVRHLQ